MIQIDVFFVSVPHLAIYIFLNFQIEPELGAKMELAWLLPHFHIVYCMR
jgi:hypothetical protein